MMDRTLYEFSALQTVKLQPYAGRWQWENMETPTALIFSRQNVKSLPEGTDYQQTRKCIHRNWV